MTRVVPLFLCSRCYISPEMSIRSAYRRMPAYFAVPLALLASAVAAVTLAALGTAALVFLLGRFVRSDDLDNAIFGFFFVAPSIVVLAFVFSFSILVNWHHETSWRTPTFAFVLGAILVWVWPLGFGGIGFAWYLPGAIAWLTSCWFLQRRSISHSKHVLQT